MSEFSLSDLHERYVNFYTDYAFKKFFGTEANKDLLISFLNALLSGQENIKDITYLPSEQLGDQAIDRKAVFDIYCENQDGDKFIIEMQKAEQKFFKDRTLYYSSFPIRDFAPKGNWDYGLKRVYCIGILNFEFDSSTKDVKTIVKLMDTDTKEIFYDKLTYIYLEMPKFVKKADELENLYEKWLFAIKNLNDLYERPVELQEKVFTKLFEIAEIAKFSPQERRIYEHSLKEYRDIYSVMKTQRDKGFQEGKEIGIQEGKEIGIQEGVISVAKNLKSMGIDYQNITIATGLTKEQIDKL